MKKIAIISVLVFGLSGVSIAQNGLRLDEANQDQLLLDTIASVASSVGGTLLKGAATVAHSIFGPAGNSLDQNELVLDEANQDKLLVDTITKAVKTVALTVGGAILGNNMSDKDMELLEESIANELENQGFDLQ